ncbi:MAG: alpha/beta fold hydrolase [Parachlamydiaceae bacterium]|nr:alpha/beta fold hydrolase [Parachlamydiaceae bacterium]
MSSIKNSANKIHALHGFLGLPSDWTMFNFIDCPMQINHSELDFISWSQLCNSEVTLSSGKNILLGYSLGGRLAMHMLLSAPSLWDAAIFVSAHPGFDCDRDRASRVASDQKWAERFLDEPWDELMCAWNENAVFGGVPLSLRRNEKDYDRKILAQQLSRWSLGNQEYLLERLKKLSIPTLYIAGQQDKKFTALAEKFKDVGSVSIIPEAAHRVPWDQPEKFTAEINQFLMDLS